MSMMNKTHGIYACSVNISVESVGHCYETCLDLQAPRYFSKDLFSIAFYAHPRGNLQHLQWWLDHIWKPAEIEH